MPRKLKSPPWVPVTIHIHPENRLRLGTEAVTQRLTMGEVVNAILNAAWGPTSASQDPSMSLPIPSGVQPAAVAAHQSMTPGEVADKALCELKGPSPVPQAPMDDHQGPSFPSKPPFIPSSASSQALLSGPPDQPEEAPASSGSTQTIAIPGQGEAAAELKPKTTPESRARGKVLKAAVKAAGFNAKGFGAQVGVGERRMNEWFAGRSIPEEREAKMKALLQPFNQTF